MQNVSCIVYHLRLGQNFPRSLNFIGTAPLRLATRVSRLFSHPGNRATIGPVSSFLLVFDHFSIFS